MLTTSIGTDLRKIDGSSENGNSSIDEVCIRLKCLNPCISPLIIGEYFSERSYITSLGQVTLSPDANRRRGFFFASSYFEVIKKCFQEEALPYAIEAFCSIKGSTPYDVGRKVALVFLIFNCSGKSLCISASETSENVRRMFKEKFGDLGLAPILPNKENLDFVSRTMGISSKVLDEFFLEFGSKSTYRPAEKK